MNFELDVHTHTIVSGHAYSTFMENVKHASDIGLKVLGTTDHAPAMPGGPHEYYFRNLKVLPRKLYGVTLLYGSEVNILNQKGNVDLPEYVLDKLDVVIASLHDICYEGGTREENTEALLNVMDNPYIDILGHIGNPAFQIYEEEVVKKAKEKNIFIEINNSSFVSSRLGSKDVCIEIAKMCKNYNTKVIVGSDAHFHEKIGDFAEAEKVLKSVNMPEDLIINLDSNKFLGYLKNKGKIQNLIID